MYNSGCIDFGKRVLKKEDIENKSIIEVGSLDINGSLRAGIEALNPASYIGVDIKLGKGVDCICKVEGLIKKFGYNSFDVVICTELLEHTGHWKKAVHNLKQIVRCGGLLLITTRSKGFQYHGYPFDFWRYEIDDMKSIFSDFYIEALDKDAGSPGVFILARKPKLFVENNLRSHKLYSIAFNKRSIIITTNIFILLNYLKMIVMKRYIKHSKYYALHYNEIPKMIKNKLLNFIKYFKN